MISKKPWLAWQFDAAGLKQTKFAFEQGISPSTLSLVINGALNPSENVQNKLEAAYPGRTIGEILKPITFAQFVATTGATKNG